MGCSVCNKNKSIFDFVNTTLNSKKEVSDCIIKKEKIDELIVLLLTQKQDSVQKNIYLGYLYSMKNLEDYCRYDINIINDFINE
ncbi:MAG: hypothetical protein ACRC5G_02715 [Cetobacterium sp.]